MDLLPFYVLAAVGVAIAAYKIFTGKQRAGGSLKKKEYQYYPLIKKEILTHNTRKFTFGLATPTTKLGLPVGGHILLKLPHLEVERPYTPVTSEDDLGHFSCIIKIYPDGKLTPNLDQVKIGEFVQARGPLGMVRYPRPGHLQKKMGKQTLEMDVRQVNMICGGTGITPMLQIANQIMKDSNDHCKMAIINGNVSSDDMLCHDLLCEMKEEATNRGQEFNVFFTLDKAPENWTGGVGYVTPDMIQANLFPASEDTVTLLCGPPPMVKGCKRSLEGLGFQKDRIIAF